MKNLYSEDLLGQAAAARQRPLPAHPDATARFRNPLCGDEITVGMVVDGGAVLEIGFALDACAVCAASAAIMADTLRGQPVDGIGAIRAQIEQVLAGQEPGEGALATMAVVAEHPSRRSCALLPWNALESVFLQIESPRELSPDAGDGGSQLAGPSRDPVDVPQHDPATEIPGDAPWQLALDLRRRGEHVALATLVSVIGSSPCPLGSRMVIAGSGSFWGSVSGGCVEAGVVQAGLDLLLDGAKGSKGRLLDFTISNSQARESLFPCGGQIQVYVERAPDLDGLTEHVRAAEGGGEERQVKIRVTDLGTGAWRLVTADDPSLPAALRNAVEAAATGNAGLVETAGNSYFVESLRSVCRLVLIGGTHIAQKLAAMAPEVGFRPIVVDPRESMVDRLRFPSTPCLVENPAAALRRLIDPHTAVVALSHKAEIDDPALTTALAAPGFYVAALGSRKTQAARLARLAAAGVPSADLARLRGPAGLPIGGKGAGEIAVSILAEIIAERRQRDRARPPVVGGMVLAAGSSRRAGSINKLLFRVDGVPMVVRAVRSLLDAGVAPVVVVLGHDHEAVRQSLSGLEVECVVHPGHQAGMGASIAAGIQVLDERGVDAALVALGDMPFVRSEDVRRLVDAHQPSTAHLILVPEFRDGTEVRAGHPVLWPRRYFGELARLDGDVGGKVIIQRDPGAVLRVPVDHDGVLIDIDRPE